MVKKEKTEKKKKFLKFIGIAIGIFIAIVLLRIVYFETFAYHPTPFVGRLLGKTPVSLELKWLHNAQFAGIYAGIKNEYFEDRDLILTLYEDDFSEKTVADSVADGDVTFGITSSYDLIQAVENGKKIKAIFALYQSSPGAIASLKSSNITKPEDFIGKKIGVSEDNSATKLFYDYLLNMHNIPRDSVEFVEIGPRQSDALTSGDVDALGIYRTDESYNLSSQGFSFRMMLPEEHGLDAYGDIIIVSNETIQKKPEMVKNFVHAVVHGWNYALQNQEEAALLSNTYSKGHYKNEWLQRYILANSEPLIKPSETQRIGEMSEEKWEKFITTLYDNGALQKEIPASEIFTNEFLPKN